MSEGTRSELVCRHCGNKVGDRRDGEMIITIKTRGRHRRSYRLPAAVAVVVSCDWCEREGAPITRTDFLAAREVGIQSRLTGWRV